MNRGDDIARRNALGSQVLGQLEKPSSDCPAMLGDIGQCCTVQFSGISKSCSESLSFKARTQRCDYAVELNQSPSGICCKQTTVRVGSKRCGSDVSKSRETTCWDARHIKVCLEGVGDASAL